VSVKSLGNSHSSCLHFCVLFLFSLSLPSILFLSFLNGRCYSTHSSSPKTLRVFCLSCCDSRGYPPCGFFLSLSFFLCISFLPMKIIYEARATFILVWSTVVCCTVVCSSTCFNFLSFFSVVAMSGAEWFVCWRYGVSRVDRSSLLYRVVLPIDNPILSPAKSMFY